MRLVACGFALGVLLLQGHAQLPSTALWLALAVAMLCCFLWRKRLQPVMAVMARPALSAALSLTLTLTTALLAGYAWSALFAHWRLSDALDPALEGRDVVLVGVVAALPQPFDRGLRFEFEVESARLASPSPIAVPAQVPERIQLAWYRAPLEDTAVLPVRAGERWRFTARLRRPHGSANPHGFDYEAWLLERGIRATGYVRPAASGSRQRLDDFVPHPLYAVERLREAVRERFRRALADAPYAGVLVALAIGDQRAIAAEDWQVFARTGVSHLMSISGLHVTMISGLIAALAMALWRRVPALVLKLPAQKAAAAAGLLAAFAYCTISGFSVPAQRTLYMVAVMALALLFDRFSSASRVLALALLVVLVLDPWAVLSPGFWLSFGAVAVIFYVGSGRLAAQAVRQSGWRDWLRPSGWLRPPDWLHPPDWLRQWGRVQWAVTVGLAPLLLALFGQVSLASPIANAVAIPLVSLVVTPLALAGAVLPFDTPLLVAHDLFELLMRLLKVLARAESAVWQQHAPVAWSVPLALVGAAWLLAPRGIPARTLGLVLMLPLFAVTPAAPRAGELWLTVLDVGQGLAVVVRTQSHTLLYDTGPAWSAQADSGSRIVLPYLRGEGVGRLDMLAVSHEDKDHAGGVASVLAAMPIGQLVSSVPAERLPAGAVPYRLPCFAGREWQWDGVKFKWLHPGVDAPQSLKRTNEVSCVLRIEAAGGSVLLAGDIEKGSEQDLLRQGRLQRADVLLVPHHGSGTSSTPEFVAAVAPRHALFSVGYRNRFGHPKAEVWARYAEASRERTDHDGAVDYRFSESGIAVQRYRQSRPRYWHGR